MGSRVGFDLTTKIGRQHFWHGHYTYVKSLRTLKVLWLDVNFWRMVLDDTFSQFWCLIVGHEPVSADEEGIACSRCHKYYKVWKFQGRVNWLKYTLTKL